MVSMWEQGIPCERCGKRRKGSSRGKNSRLCKDCSSVEPDWPLTALSQLEGQEESA